MIKGIEAIQNVAKNKRLKKMKKNSKKESNRKYRKKVQHAVPRARAKKIRKPGYIFAFLVLYYLYLL